MDRIAHTAPLPATAVDLLTRADAELLAAQFSSEPGERFVHAHLAGLRAAAAVLAAVAPEVGSWSAYFAAGAGLRRAIDAGRADAVDDARAEQVLCAAEDFLDEVRALIDPAGAAATGQPQGSPQRLSVRAS